MKKPVAILTLLLYCFNLFGYMIVFDLLQRSANSDVVSYLEEGAYADADLVEVKVAYRLPYSIDQKEYERVNGTISIQGEEYNYVKKRLTHDTLYMLCMPNKQSTAVSNARQQYASKVNDIGNSGKKEAGTSQALQLFFATYTKTACDYNLESTGNMISTQYHYIQTYLCPGFDAAFYQPPRLTA